MKKLLTILITFSTLLFWGGCTNKDDNLGKEISTIKNSKDGPQWPSEKWSISTPEDQGLDSKVLDSADKRIKENYPNIYSLLVVRHGYLVYEKYYQGMDQDSANPVFSVTKSIISALTGIGLKENIISNIDDEVDDYLPEYFLKDDDKKSKIKIRDVLTMTGGLESIDNDYRSYFSSPDWMDYAIRKPLIDKPGEKFVYNTGLTQLLSGVITKTSKQDTFSFSEKYLFNEIGISADRWDKDSMGYYGGGTGLQLTPRDMAKFGYLYLNKGLWDGKQIIPREWVEESTKKQVSVELGLDYGYLFWIQNMVDEIHNKEYFTYRADGAGGQKVIVIPDLDMVVVITANLQSSSKDKTDTQELIPAYVIPAVKQ